MDFIWALILSRISAIVAGPDLDIERAEAPREEPVKTMVATPDPEQIHETAAVLRMQRSGMSAPLICSLLKMSKDQLVHELKLALDDEGEAHRRGMSIHDATVTLKAADEGQRTKHAKDIKVGEILPEHGSVVLKAMTIYEGTTPSRIVFTLSSGLTCHYAAYDKVWFEEDSSGGGA